MSAPAVRSGYFGGPVGGGPSDVSARRRLFGAAFFATRFLVLRFFAPFDLVFAFPDFFLALARFTVSPFS